jgi:predicted nucleic acid-binding protein
MNQPPVPLFIDTGAFFARFNERAYQHDRARAVFRGIQSREFEYGPLFTSRYVLSELATLMRRKVGHEPAVTALETIRRAVSFNLLPVGDDAFDRTCKQFARYDDQHISFVGHSSGVLADAYEVGHVFTFDPTDFRVLGFAAVPDDTGEA